MLESGPAKIMALIPMEISLYPADIKSLQQNMYLMLPNYLTKIYK